ncbi:DUF58 domain-containing protein [Parahaliea mediterranea]|uniref:DUF58 domain-containing protein n=1 Tax=Parahaliea mediterranea TaxID=651086 RepID=A0A939INA5_9GAMM|nr:DUF58 domain-containing protein [Parahaliea mediterranea]MBN7797852.1 DUF58 domain-containing protein [Parahaliea mediterranea]
MDDDVYTSLRALTRLRHSAHGFSYLPKQPLGSLLTGRKRSRLRGRGLDFDELRHYRPGDDIRNMDWRVTNRTGKPHVRVYTEERDRPAILLVDQRLSMFFGSRRKMKSVVAAEAASLAAWRVLGVGDRVGALLFNDSESTEVGPSRSEKKTLAWLGQLVAMNRRLSVDAPRDPDPRALDRALQAAERRIGHDYLLMLISDFSGFSERTLAALRRIRRHNDVVCSLVYDPLERDITQADKLVVSDGQYQLEVDPRRHQLGEKFEAHFSSGLARVQADLRRHDIPVILLDTEAPVPDQVRRQLGQREASR